MREEDQRIFMLQLPINYLSKRQSKEAMENEEASQHAINCS